MWPRETLYGEREGDSASYLLALKLMFLIVTRRSELMAFLSLAGNDNAGCRLRHDAGSSTGEFSQRNHRRLPSVDPLCQPGAGHRILAPMQNPLRTRARNDRLALLDEVEKSDSPSYFQWREQTIRTQAYQPVPKPQPGSIVRLFRRLAG